MQVELYCPKCAFRFAAAPETPALQVMDRMFESGPWFALGDGETFEDMIFHSLMSEGEICCPECDEPVHVAEESLGQLAQEMLSHF